MQRLDHLGVTALILLLSIETDFWAKIVLVNFLPVSNNGGATYHLFGKNKKI